MSTCTNAANAGSLLATGASSILYLGTNGSSWSNTGSITASAGGTVDFGGSYASSNLSGTINGTGGTLNLTGSVDNSSAVLNAPTSGIFTLSGGTISGGTVASGALTFGSTTGTLNGVTMSGTFASVAP